MTSKRLSRATLADANAIRPAYDLDKVELGVAHIGPGAFHRAHQAWYFDQLLARDPRWGISAIAPRSRDVRDALAPQDGLYVLAELDAQISYRVIGSLRELHVASEDLDATLVRLTDPTTKLVTMTVTEKGYCLDGKGELDLNHATIQHDLANPASPQSIAGILTLALAQRRADKSKPFTVLSCDNLADNGAKLKRAVIRFAETRDGDLARWIGDNVRFPATMVDSITPATTDALRQQVEAATGVYDAWPIQRESFVQWVIEDTLGPDAPDLASVGVILTKDVAAWDRAKLRLLNAAHSTLAYTGWLVGHETVADVMTDPKLVSFVRGMLLDDVAPSLTPPAGLSLADYVEMVLTRFRNPAIRHELQQIAWDGSQKLPVRILGTLRDARLHGRSIDRLAVPLGAWMRFVMQRAKSGEKITDPLAEQLQAIGQACNGEAEHDVPRFLAIESMFPRDLANDPSVRIAIERAYTRA
ncbi:mannitol dehydrogenase family protein [Roseiterribacter gracilis]|uniref:Mannitol 2-dehydrogenase n=1 Tax=Roseiterribacter gracilis TaxID=2812848 RepID=A0A8S8XCQ3_9PROT|nr:mannitol 2-dehydrogenase [Rhodospirillales bacterium TMPK1]